MCGKVAGGEGNEAVGLVFDVVFEVEVVLLGSESGGQGGEVIGVEWRTTEYLW